MGGLAASGGLWEVAASSGGAAYAVRLRLASAFSLLEASASERPAAAAVSVAGTAFRSATGSNPIRYQRGPNNPTGFILTAVLGITGAFLATFIGQTIGWYSADQGAGFIAATVGAIVVLLIWHRLVVRRLIPDPGVPGRPDGSGTGRRV